MKIAFNIFLILIIVFLGFMLYKSIQDPIEFNAEKTKRENAVIQRLMDVRSSQEIYRLIKGDFAKDFETLISVLQTARIPILKMVGDKDATDGVFSVDTTYVNAIDSINSLKIVLDSLPFIPYSGGKRFSITAENIEFQKTMVPVLEVSTVKKDFMGQFGDARYSMYDKSFNPKDVIKFGDLSKPSLAGNWE
ncbi:MAG TPA: hypothetical protein DCX89_09145 [Saprospirales bacterium]|nr:hypothetical protein [Saprospirales bacterium]